MGITTTLRCNVTLVSANPPMAGIEMQMAPWLLPSMRRRYRGPVAPVADLRVFDARAMPAALGSAHPTRATTVGGVPGVLIHPEREGRGVIVFLHGGAHVYGPGPGRWEWLCGMSDATGVAGLMLLYDRAPEARCPTSLDQVVAACDEIVGDRVLSGDSSGGGLALAAAMRMGDEGRALPRALVLSSPWLDLTMSNPGLIANTDADVMLGTERLAEYARAHAGDADLHDPLVSPAFGDPTGLPPMLITSGGAELMRAEIRDWAAACPAVGTPCEVIEVDGAIHDFAMARTLFPEAREVFPRMAAFAARQ